ncbi:MAG: peptidase M14 [Rhodothermales bacterium]|nr:peptidase M14 [Rhodothermales bacterium]
MLDQIIPDGAVRFRTQDEVEQLLLDTCRGSVVVQKAEILGRSGEGRNLLGFVIGGGGRRISLIAGNHSDEPVGPETLRHLVIALASEPERYGALLETFTFSIVPHSNPDGESRNGRWIEQWPDPEAYLEHAFRELPGRDVEFAFPDGRVENRAVSSLLVEQGPFEMHCSLHGMGFSDGAFLLIDRRWGFRTEDLQQRFRELAVAAGLGLHDHNRQGEKGFFYLGPGFNTTPEGEAMRTFFLSRGDEEMASRFRQSSMDYVRSLGGDPLCLVTEMPLFLIGREPPPEQDASSPYVDFRDRLKNAVGAGEQRQLLDEFEVRPFDLREAMRMQLSVIEAGLETLLKS